METYSLQEKRNASGDIRNDTSRDKVANLDTDSLLDTRNTQMETHRTILHEAESQMETQIHTRETQKTYRD
jgi:hypothetical protein